MLNINDRMKELSSRITDYSEQLTEYSGTTYICDAISEIADGNTSIYYNDIRDFIAGHVEEVNETIKEFGFDGCGNDLYKAGQMAEYTTIENEIYNELDEAIEYCMLSYLHNIGVEELTDEQAEALTLHSLDNNNDFDDLYEYANSVIDEEAA